MSNTRLCRLNPSFWDVLSVNGASGDLLDEVSSSLPFASYDEMVDSGYAGHNGDSLIKPDISKFRESLDFRGIDEKFIDWVADLFKGHLDPLMTDAEIESLEKTLTASSV